MRYVITGAKGLIGREVLLRLVAYGHDVAVVTRSIERASSLLGADPTYVCWSDSDGLREVLNGCDGVIHLAGEPIADRRWTTRRKQRLWSSRVELTQTLVQVMGRCKRPPKALVCASAVGFYGHRLSPVEETSHRGEGFTSLLTEAWEAAALDATQHGVRVVSLRIGLVLARQGVFKWMRRAYRARVGARIGSGRQGMPWIHIDDVVGVCLWVLKTKTIQGPVNAVAPALQTQTSFHDECRQFFGRQMSPPISPRALRWVLGERSRLITHGARVEPTAAREGGYSFLYPTLRGALSDLVSGSAACGVTIRRVREKTAFGGTVPQYRLMAKTFVPQPIERVTPWFETPSNLTLMTPPFMRFKILSQQPMERNAEMTYCIQLFGFPMRWTSRIPIFERGVRFVDTQARGPYRLWWHEHVFESAPGGTWITDTVHYRIPLGLLGRLVHRVWVRSTLQNIFVYREHTMHSRFCVAVSETKRISA